MRQLLGPIAVHAAMLAAGMGILRTLGIVRRGSLVRWAAAAGLAYLCGVAGVMLISIIGLVLGASFDLKTFAVVAAILALPLLLELRGARRLAAVPRVQPRQWSAEVWIAIATLTAFAVFAIVGIFTVGNTPVVDYDAWNLWSRKAQLLFLDGHLPLDIFKSAAYRGGGNSPGNIHADYPLLIPMLEAVHLRGLGRPDVRQVHEVFWLLLIAFVWAGGFLASRISRAMVWSVILCGAALLIVKPLLIAYADVPMALFLGTGVLALGLWLESAARSDLALAALLLGGAASVKNEGLLGAVAALLVALVMTLHRRERAVSKDFVLASVAIALVALLPWRLWLAAHGIRGDLPLGHGLNPSFLADRIDRLWPSIGALHDQLANPESVAVFAAIGIALAAVRMSRAERVPVAAFYLGTGILYFAALVWAYWISPLPLRFHLDRSVTRVYLGLAFVAIAAILHLGDRQRGLAVPLASSPRCR